MQFSAKWMKLKIVIQSKIIQSYTACCGSSVDVSFESVVFIAYLEYLQRSRNLGSSDYRARSHPTKSFVCAQDRQIPEFKVGLEQREFRARPTHSRNGNFRIWSYPASLTKASRSLNFFAMLKKKPKCKCACCLFLRIKGLGFRDADSLGKQKGSCGTN